MVWNYEYASYICRTKSIDTKLRPVNSLGSFVGFLGAIPGCFVCPNPYKPVSQGNVGLVTKFGRFYRAVDPGLVKINPLSERLIQVDVKIQIVGTYQQPPQTHIYHPTNANVSPRRRGPATSMHDKG